ncbi:uncharacterized protein L3040_003090 [Drepanopeziza brunnea f. sp. 'multigermtubi']|uniref:uncharacterized protein n=1 Tax=Drepanopeziza brunnea f. sp. 'multigermtubi' TaxID=698441 RepID=UPI00239397F8|nr:hypothetical protein L3040_003090 [Drepanopeziza brunnea f. sp. 'multigermtubi']
MPADKIQEGDKVSWNWGGSHPSGVAAEVKEGDVSVTSHKGNEITKHGEEGNPAVHIARSGNDVVKKASELQVDSKASRSNGTSSEAKREEAKDDDKAEGDAEESPEEDSEKSPEEDSRDAKAGGVVESENEDGEEGGAEAQAGDKRKADEKADASNDEEEDAGAKNTKKQKASDDDAESAAANGKKKKGGHLKGTDSDKKPAQEKREPAAGRAERKTQSQSKTES